MARKPRIHYPGAFYHVIVRGNGRQIIFKEDEDFLQYIALIEENKARYRFRLYAYVLMSNHAHLLVEVSDIPLSRIMQNLQFRYTRNYNTKYRSSGHLFQGRYKAILCDKDSYFIELSAYIHLNPVRAGIVRLPVHYKWSSYRSYVKGEQGLVETDFLLSQFSRNRADARKEYIKYVRGHMPDGHRDDLYDVHDQRFLGEDDFIEEVSRQLNENTPRKYTVAIEDTIATVSRHFKIKPEEVCSMLRSRKGAEARAVVGYLSRKLCDRENKEVANYFDREPAALSYGVKKLEKRLLEDTGLAEKVKKLERTLKQKGNNI